MAKKNSLYLICAIVIVSVVALYIYSRCKISCKAPESFYYDEKLDNRSLIDEHNICRYDDATKNFKCRATGLRCSNPEGRCGPLHNCTTNCCHSGNGKTGLCRGRPDLPCYDIEDMDCGGSHGTMWY
jgi:hypothetical protein